MKKETDDLLQILWDGDRVDGGYVTPHERQLPPEIRQAIDLCDEHEPANLRHKALGDLADWLEGHVMELRMEQAKTL